MKNVFQLFHYLSHLKYPLLLFGLYLIYQPLLSDAALTLDDINSVLIIFGVALSLDSLKDYKKLNWLDKKVYHHPKRAKVYFLVFGSLLLLLVFSGLYSYFFSSPGPQKDLSIGLMVFGIGCFGMLKSAMQATSHYLDNHH
jgi:hypothetical protein